MRQSTYRIVLDIHDAHSSVCLDMKKNDTARRITIALTDGGFPYQISEECYAVFTATKPDGNIVCHPCRIESNIIIYDVEPQTTAAVGLAECEIKLYGADDKLITSPGFNILISDTSYTEGDEVESETEVSTLTHLISKATTVITEGENVNEQSEALIQDMEAKRTELEQQITEAKESAGDAKQHAFSASFSANLATQRATQAAEYAANARAYVSDAQSAATAAQGHTRNALDAAENARLRQEAAAVSEKSAAEYASQAKTSGLESKGNAQEAKESREQAAKSAEEAIAAAKEAKTASDNCKNAYEYAQEAGYTGTEEEFGKKMAEENTFEVTVTKNASGGYSASATSSNISAAANAGKIVTCRLDESVSNGSYDTAGAKVYHLVRSGFTNSPTVLFVHESGNKIETIQIRNVLSTEVVTIKEYTLATEGYVTETVNQAIENADIGGKDGKSAYEYAKEAGYTGTEEEFAKDLANGGGSGDAGEAILYSPQELSDERQTQARSNIGAAQERVMVTLTPDPVTGYFTSSHRAAEIHDLMLAGREVYTLLADGTMTGELPLVGTNATEDGYQAIFSATFNDPSNGTPLNAIVGVFDLGSITAGLYVMRPLVRAEDVPTKLPSPYRMTISKSSYDGTAPVDFTDTINSMIVAKTPTIPTVLPNPNALTIDGKTYDGSNPVTVYTGNGKSVLAYGAMGDGEYYDTIAFQNALAENRVVHVPGGTYKLSGELRIRGNCCLVLSQDTVLEFTQISGNCISMEMSASIRGHHGLIKVPYGFSGNVINVNTALNEDVTAIEPWNRWDPQWKAGRYITDLNITKHDSKGFCYANQPGDCKGTAIYISADRNGTSANRSTFIWGLDFSGIRIAGAFSYGIRAVNYNDAWNHEMRIAAFISNTEIGVSLEDCNNAYISAVIEPRYAESDGTNTGVYAKHGIQLIRSTNADLSGSRVWDWNADGTLWVNGGQWQHIGMYGDCHGAILNSFEYYDVSIDIRDLIYTDTPSNLEKITILQEPFTRWFKPKDGQPYFYNGNTEKKLMTKDDFDECFTVDAVNGYTDALATAIGTDGAVYDGIGYKRSGAYLSSVGTESAADYYGCTGFIPCKNGDTLHVQGIQIKLDAGQSDSTPKIVFYDENFNYVYMVTGWNIRDGDYAGTVYSYTEGNTASDFAYRLISNRYDANAKGTTVAYARLTYNYTKISEYPVVSVNDEIKQTYEGFLADGIKVKGESVLLSSPGGKTFTLKVADDGTLTTEPLAT